MIYRCLNQLRNSQKTVEVLLDNGQSSFKGKVIDLDTEYVVMSIFYDDGMGDFEPTWHEAVIKLSHVSSIIYERELAPFLNEEKQKQYEGELEQQ